MMTLATLLILMAFALWFIVLGYERGWWRGVRPWPEWANTRRRVAVWCVFVLVFSAFGADKAPGPRIMRMLLWHSGLSRFFGSSDVPKERTVTEAEAALDGAETNMVLTASHAETVSNVTADVIAAASTAECWTVDCDWPLASRYDTYKNVLVSFSWSQPTNVSGVLYDDNYLEFSQTPGDAPQMLFDYHDRLGRTNYVTAVTNSYPDTFVVQTQSGSHTCYWFRCEVPSAFTNCVRTWDDEARLGGPVGSDQGFDIAGTLLLDDGGTLYQGRTLTTVIGGVDCEFQHGLLVAPQIAAAAAAPEEERSLWSRLMSSLSRRSPVVIRTPSNVVVITGSKTNVYPLAFQQ